METPIGIIGGSGFYSLLDNVEDLSVDTKYGKPSDAFAMGTISGRKVAFLARHGRKHTIPPHKVPYRANIEAFAQIGVTRIVATSTVGSLKFDYRPGDIAIFDQLVNHTQGRIDTFFDENTVAHVSAAEPYCPELRGVSLKMAKASGMPMHESGTVAIINGPRFSTKAESKIFSSQGSHMISMTQYPEPVLARERQICYVGIGLITDYDAGLEGRNDIMPVSMSEVLKIFGQNVDKAKKLVKDIVPEIPESRSCNCSKSLDGAMPTQK